MVDLTEWLSAGKTFPSNKCWNCNHLQQWIKLPTLAQCTSYQQCKENQAYDRSKNVAIAIDGMHSVFQETLREIETKMIFLIENHNLH